jgi:hypothetical protein
MTVIKSRTVERMGDLVCMWEKGNAYKILVGKREEKRLVEYPDVNGK